MSVIRSVLYIAKNITFLNNRLINVPVFCSKPVVRSLSLTAWRRDDGEEEEEGELQQKEEIIDPAKDRRRVISVETSIKYLQSKAFEETYGGEPVWKSYRRNHKGQFPRPKTRKRCIRRGILSTGHPCPICRDEYLVLDYRNIELLKHFISPHTGEILSYTKTAICQFRYNELILAMAKARNYGLLSYDVPFRKYDYKQYYDMKTL